MIARMRRAASAREFMADPIGRYLVGRAFVVWAYSSKLAGASYFGRIELADYDEILEVFDLYRHPAIDPPFRALMDGSGTEAFDARGFELLSRYVSRWPEIAARLERVAIVRPPG